jgi:hypothetical protein
MDLKASAGYDLAGSDCTLSVGLYFLFDLYAKAGTAPGPT